MKYKTLLIGLFVIALLATIMVCRLNLKGPHNLSSGVTLSSEKDVIEFALEAEKHFYGVIFNSNEEYLRKWGYHSLPIKTKADMEKMLSPYWTKDVTDKLWKLGSSQMPDLPFGMYNDDFSDLGLLQAKTLKVVKINDKEWLVSGEIVVEANELTSGYHYTKKVYVIKTLNGWQAKIDLFEE